MQVFGSYWYWSGVSSFRYVPTISFSRSIFLSWDNIANLTFFLKYTHMILAHKVLDQDKCIPGSCLLKRIYWSALQTPKDKNSILCNEIIMVVIKTRVWLHWPTKFELFYVIRKTMCDYDTIFCADFKSFYRTLPSPIVLSNHMTNIFSCKYTIIPRITIY